MSTILVTGANRGIGLELVRQGAASGAMVVATCRDPDKAPALQALAAGANGKVRVEACDVASAASVAALKQTLGSEPLDVLINNAGIMGADPQTAADMNFDVLSQVLEVNLHGALRVTQALLDNVAATEGKIAVISSMMAQYQWGSPGKTAYCVSKTAVSRAFNLLASELRPSRITVAILSPGWVSSDMGGASAPVTPERCAKGLLKQIGGWTLKDSGAFRDFEGRALEW